MIFGIFMQSLLTLERENGTPQLCIPCLANFLYMEEVVRTQILLYSVTTEEMKESYIHGNEGPEASLRPGY